MKQNNYPSKSCITNLIIAFLLFFPLFVNCGRQSSDQTPTANKTKYSLFKKMLPGSKKTTPITKPSIKSTTNKQKESITPKRRTKYPELDFEIKNQTGKTLYVTCFTYIKKLEIERWRWDKSSVYKLENNQSVIVNIDTIIDEKNRKYIFGYLATFDNEKEANESIYELLDDKQKIDLDLIYKLKDKIVIIDVERYGFKKERLDFDIVQKSKKKRKPSEYDFAIENQTSKTIYVAGFIYQVKDDIRSLWTYDKTPVQKLLPGQVSIIDVDTIAIPRNRKYMRGFLGVFEEYEEKLARNSTFELLAPKYKVKLGRLSKLKNKKIVLDIEKYGAVGDIIDYVIKPTRRISFKKQK